ncbi:uncharacterized protein FOBCDRAFT_35799 [Fusarium oxysporum Fo47]|uniref:uncharacterized protein n=1 Tax=Fusarium oxysporum Fo47 TaxID=660027 RepID=UPI002869D902|nr:uncharacterized protein FOBCDRAFT_35799 [Fusarium oxysporum Fo47]WJG35337.1 hypothetical protein FOBCDRAFT_35799 [Fusarium oxysporum Fo47]
MLLDQFLKHLDDTRINRIVRNGNCSTTFDIQSKNLRVIKAECSRNFIEAFFVLASKCGLLLSHITSH